MGATSKHRQRLAGEDGFTLVEVLAAVVILSIGIIAMIAVYDATRAQTDKDQRYQIMAAVAQQTIEADLNYSYANFGLSSSPPACTAPCTDPNDPLKYVSGTNYQYDWTGGLSAEPLVTGGSIAPSSNWSSGGWSGTVYQFVTGVDDPCPTCTATPYDYKRITIAVKIDGKRPAKPYLISTVRSS
jgi:prepilin-type N-terminal cleavage/methylation domain-containing protein